MELNFEYMRLEYVERDVKYLTRPFRSKSKDLKLEQLILYLKFIRLYLRRRNLLSWLKKVSVNSFYLEATD